MGSGAEWFVGVFAMRQPPPQKTIDRVKRAVESGVSAAEVARQEGVTPSTISRWLRVYGGTTATEAKRAKAPAAGLDLVRRLSRLAKDLETAELVDEARLIREAVDALDAAPRAPQGAPNGAEQDVTLPDPADGALNYLRALARLIESEVHRSRMLADGKLAQHIATLGKLMPQIKALELAEREGTDAIVIPRGDLEELRTKWLERSEQVLRDPPRCAECGKRLRVAEARGLYEGTRKE